LEKCNINHTIRFINKFIIICRKRKLINKNLYSFSEPKITAVIILHNSEKTIKTSIRSVQNQNISDIEIILVDDCSSDKSLKIINNMAEKDSRVKIIRNKKNRGSLYSRSIGTLNSKGRYIMALDSDDIFSNEFLFYKCYKESEKNDLDILEFSGFRVKKTILEKIYI
jgi:glycosyltransferase involved in cell wall biosynthesis